MRIRSIALALVTVAVHGCAAQPVEQAPVQPAATTAAGAPGEVVCREHEQTGTRFKKQKCRDKSQADTEARQSRETLRETLRKGGNTAEQGVMPGN